MWNSYRYLDMAGILLLIHMMDNIQKELHIHTYMYDIRLEKHNGTLTIYQGMDNASHHRCQKVSGTMLVLGLDGGFLLVLELQGLLF